MNGEGGVFRDEVLIGHLYRQHRQVASRKTTCFVRMALFVLYTCILFCMFGDVRSVINFAVVEAEWSLHVLP